MNQIILHKDNPKGFWSQPGAYTSLWFALYAFAFIGANVYLQITSDKVVWWAIVPTIVFATIAIMIAGRIIRYSKENIYGFSCEHCEVCERYHDFKTMSQLLQRHVSKDAIEHAGEPQLAWYM